jgi:glycosyltransferase involved in cell wall biosynthesis
MRSSRQNPEPFTVAGSGKRICLITPAVVPHDAIGNDVRGMAQILRRRGYDVEVYADSIHPALASEARKLQIGTDSFWRRSDTMVIYHHSMGWPDGQAVVSEAKCRVVIKHHNVTPPRFFEQYSDDHAAACVRGEHATRELAAIPGATFWADSQFNAKDLIQYGAPPENCRVLPPFHRTHELAAVPMALDVVRLCKQYTGLRILFVGGLKPNKGHFRLIRALAAYRRYADPEAVLILPGTFDPRLSPYTDKLRRWALQLGVESAVIFAGPVDDSQLRTWYSCADVFLCLSEHEGFCVPLLEAMHFRLPIIAHRSTAIPETVGDAALLWEEHEHDCIIESLVMCQERDERYRLLATAGWERYFTNYTEPQIAATFLALVEEALHGGPA